MKKIRLITICLLTFLFVLPAFAQERAQSQNTDTAEDLSALRQLKGKVFELKYRTPSSIVRAITPLGSGYKYAVITPSDELRIVTVRDWPENIAAIEEAIKRLDVQQTIKTQINLETQVSLIAASRNAGPASGDVPSSISTVMEELRNTLKFKSYRYITTFVNRTSDEGSVTSSGAADSFFQLQMQATKGIPNFYNYDISGIRLVTGENGEQMIQVRDFKFNMRVAMPVGTATPAQVQYSDLGVRTPLSMKDGEYVVVGTSNFGTVEEALIVVVSIKRVK